MVVGENGILNRAQDASKKTKFASEKEAIEFIMSDIKTGLMIGENIPKSKYLGEELKNRKIGEEWKMITVGENAYGTGWYLLEKGKEIDGYGKSNLNWLINYNTGEIIELEEGNYSNLSSNDAVVESCRNNIIFSLDASSIGKATKVADLESADVDFIGFDDEETNENSGITENSFKFDGVDDYVKIKYDDSPALNQDGTPYEEDGKQLTKKEVFAKNGFTFEFYGVLDDGTAAGGQTYRGLFNYGQESKGGIMRFGIIDNGSSIFWNAGFGNFVSDLSASTTAPWNQIYYIKDAKKDNGEKIIESESMYDKNIHHLVLSIDASKIYETVDDVDYYKHTIYLDGIKAIDAKYNVNSWNSFLGDSQYLNYFEIGRAHMSEIYYQCYSKMEAYTLRLYNRALTDEEVEKSYQNSLILQK